MTADTKVCTACKVAKPATLTYFWRDKRLKSGLASQCQECAKAANRLWAEAHRAERALYRAEYWSANREECNARNRAWAATHDRTEYNRSYRLDNLERMKAKDRAYARSEAGKRKARKQYLKHRDKLIAAATRWNKAHREIRAVREALRRARVSAGGTFSVEEWNALKEKYDHRCLRCGRREGEIKLTPDHVIPIVHGGLNVVENIQPLCSSCNSSKRAKHDDYRPKRS